MRQKYLLAGRTTFVTMTLVMQAVYILLPAFNDAPLLSAVRPVAGTPLVPPPIASGTCWYQADGGVIDAFVNVTDPSCKDRYPALFVGGALAMLALSTLLFTVWQCSDAKYKRRVDGQRKAAARAKAEAEVQAQAQAQAQALAQAQAQSPPDAQAGACQPLVSELQSPAPVTAGPQEAAQRTAAATAAVELELVPVGAAGRGTAAAARQTEKSADVKHVAAPSDGSFVYNGVMVIRSPVASLSPQPPQQLGSPGYRGTLVAADAASAGLAGGAAAGAVAAGNADATDLGDMLV
jgi:hypothetical protein